MTKNPPQPPFFKGGSGAMGYKQREIAKIHIAKNQLGLDDDTYRALLHHLAGVSSSKDLTALGRAKVLAHFKAAGFKETTRPKRPKTADTRPQLGKIEALLADMRLPWSYALALAKQMYRKDRLEFCTAKELTGIITALIKKQAVVLSEPPTRLESEEVVHG